MFGSDIRKVFVDKGKWTVLEFSGKDTLTVHVGNFLDL